MNINDIKNSLEKDEKYVIKKYNRLWLDKKLALVLKEKYGQDMYFISSLDQLKRTCLHILVRRYESGDYYYDPNNYKPEPPSMTKDDMKKLKDGKIKDFAKEEWVCYEKSMEDYDQASYNFERIKKAIKTENGSTAFVILENRSNYEYEEMEITELNEF